MADQIFEIHDPEIDVEEIMRRIQENIRRRKAVEEGGVQTLFLEEGAAGNGQEALEPLALIPPPLRAGVQEVGRSHDTFTRGSLSPSRTRFKALTRSLFVRVVHFYAYWQVQWNATVAQVLDSLLHVLEGIEVWLQRVREEMRWVREATGEVQRAIGEAQEEIKWAREAIGEVQGVVGETQQWTRGAIGEVQGAIGQTQQGLEWARGAIEEVQRAVGETQQWAREAIGEVQGVVGETQQWARSAIEEVQKVVGEVQGVVGETQQWARSAIEEVQRATGETQQWAREAIGEVQGAIGETQRGIEWAKGAIGEVQEVVGRVAEGQEGLRRQMEEEGRELRRHLGVLGIRFRGLEGKQQSARDLVEQLSVQTREAQEELKRQGELLGNQLKEEGERLRAEARTLREEGERFQTEVQTLREEVTDLHKRHTDLARHYEELQQENVLQKRRLDLLLGELRKKAGLDGTSVQRIVAEGERLLDHTYFLFENHFRGTQEEVRKRQEVYLPVFRDCLTPTSPLLQNGGFVLDLGCGRGEMLEILRAARIPARGVDINEDMVYLCRQKGLEVVQDDLFAYLRSLPAESLAGAISCQVIEHLTVEQNIELLKLLLDKLSRGGRLILETVNPENLLVSSFHFHLDLSHKLKIPAVALAFLAESLGFTVLETRYLSPYSEELHFHLVEGENNSSYLHSLNENFRRLDHFFFGPQDYALICCKGQVEDGLGTSGQQG